MRGRYDYKKAVEAFMGRKEQNKPQWRISVVDDDNIFNVIHLKAKYYVDDKDNYSTKKPSFLLNRFWRTDFFPYIRNKVIEKGLNLRQKWIAIAVAPKVSDDRQ